MKVGVYIGHSNERGSVNVDMASNLPTIIQLTVPTPGNSAVLWLRREDAKALIDALQAGISASIAETPQ